MKWFEGSINEAVATSKSRKAIFVVFVEGKDDTSAQFAQAINATEVSSVLEKEQFVAIKLESGSETYRFFVQIYQLVPVPSLFFIGENGTPLEIVAGNTTATHLVNKIDAVLTKAGKSPQNASSTLIEAEKQSSTPSNNEKILPTTDNEKNPHISNEIQAESKKEEEVPASSEKISTSKDKTDNELPADIQKPGSSKSSDEVPTTSTEKTEEPALSAEEKVERARQLIELQRRQRQEEEERKEREREIERRKMGRDVQKMRQKQHELEIKQAHEERMREKAAETAAREKVRQQIAQDKLERKQKEQALQQKNQQNVPEQPQPRAPMPVDATVTRIQFRLPSGNPHMGQFEPSTTLGALRSYVVENIDIPFPRFTMSTSFPRRELTNDDDNKTLLELELVPTAVILILPLKSSNVSTTVTSTQDVGFFSRFIWTLFAPLFGVYNFVMNYFRGGGGGNTDRQLRGSNDELNSSNIRNDNVRDISQSSNLIRRNLGNQGSTTVRAQGNIHRLHSAGDDNDENNTWNGNSTQQM